VYLGHFLGSIRGTFRPMTLVGSSIDMPISRGVLVPLVNIAVLLVIANMFINICLSNP
jgi:hypothetical protein